MLKRLKSVFTTPEVEFLCAEEDYGVIPEPYPSRKFLPEWYKNLPPKVGKQDKLENSTIKRCAPFLDAMTVGWIIPLAADVEIISNDDATGINYRWLFNKPMIENHQHTQVTGHPSLPKPPMKFLNYWFIKIPRGYSALFLPPLNRPDPRFQCISGLVDDGYMGNGALEYINFPFFFTQPNYTGILKAGTPLVQMILLKRDGVMKSSRRAQIGKVTQQDIDLVTLTRRRRSSHESLYRDKLREPK